MKRVSIIAAFLFALCLQAEAQFNGCPPGFCNGSVASPNTPTVDLNLAAGTATGCAAISACLTNTNSTGGYCTDSGGVLHLIGANTLRVCSGSGLLTEEGRTNLLLQSQALATTPWTISVGSMANNALSAPDGTTTASSLTDTGATTVFQVSQTAAAGVSSTSVLSVYLKSGSQSWGVIQANNNGASAAAVAYFQLTGSGTLGSITNLVGSGAITSSSITALANGWYRCSVTVGSLGAGTIFIGPASSNNGRSYTGTSSIAIYTWGAQFEAGVTFPTSYFPTTLALASRSADNIAVSGVLATTLGGSTGTVVANTSGSQQSLAGTIVDANGVILTGKTLGNAGTTSVGAALSTANTGTWTGSNDLGLAWDASGGAIQLNGGSVATDSTARTPSATFHIGSTGGSSAFFDGYLTRLRAYTSKLASPQ